MIAIATWPTCADGVSHLAAAGASFPRPRPPFVSRAVRSHTAAMPSLWASFPILCHAAGVLLPPLCTPQRAPNGRDSSSVPKDQEAGGPVTQIIG